MNPKQMVMNLLRQNMTSNPMVNNLMSMAQNGDSKGVENFARNFCKEKGVDFDTEFSKFMGQFKR